MGGGYGFGFGFGYVCAAALALSLDIGLAPGLFLGRGQYLCFVEDFAFDLCCGVVIELSLGYCLVLGYDCASVDPSSDRSHVLI